MEYRVLARKYRPTNFDDLIGQEALVRTLSNAIESGRIAHAFLLTGIRGVGKTTTARIIARALNCEKGPTINPCGVCANCNMIAEDRHMDVLEMDAASHTGVGDIRELIDTVRYAPTSARYKIYIIDEVHMLSTSAFNALLKTLEEPPPHVKFIFATTEARKIPVTILSRCQRFDLKRVDVATLAKHLANICAKEQVKAEEDALQLIAVSAEGSVRDALSLLDQAIARASNEAISAMLVRQMIGSADNTVTFRMIEALLKGDIALALSIIREHYTAGADPLLMVQDALEATHLITRIKVAPDAAQDITLSQHDREVAKKLADVASMPVLARLWQMLLKGITEVRLAPSPLSALEMLSVRIAYAADLPTPAQVIRSGGGEEKALAPKPNLELVGPQPNNFAEVVDLFSKNRELMLYTTLREHAHVVQCAAGVVEMRLSKAQPRDFSGKVAECLSRWTGQPWKILLSEEEGAPTLREQESTRKEAKMKEVTTNPLVASVLEQFPGAKVLGVKTE